MRRDIVFVHIPKTAGTSLRLALQERAAADHLLLLDYDFEPATTPELLELVHRQGRLADFRQHFNRKDRGILLTGHFHAKRYWEFFNAESFVTFIRNPVDRVLSEYNHFITHKGFEGTIEEFAHLPRFRNLMSRVLSNVNLAAFGFIGITEEFERSLGELGNFVEAELPSLKANRGNYQEKEGMEIRSRGDVRAMIADLNRQDIDLYERLVRERSGACRPFDGQPLPTDGYRSSVSLTKQGNIIGWACNATREFICDVEILQNDRLLGSVEADLYRADLRERHVSRSGVCGFSLNRARLSTMGVDLEGTLTLKVRGTNYELKGSPVKLTPDTIAASP